MNFHMIGVYNRNANEMNEFIAKEFQEMLVLKIYLKFYLSMNAFKLPPFQAYWYVLVIPALWRQRHSTSASSEPVWLHSEFIDSLDYTRRPRIKNIIN